MDGGHGHSGGGGGAHSHGGSGASIGSPIPIFIPVVVLGLSIEGILHLGQFAYGTIYHVHVAKVAGDWGSLFLNIGLALVLTVVAALAFVWAVFARQPGALVVTLVATTLAAIFGLVLAPHFAGKVVPPARAEALIVLRRSALNGPLVFSDRFSGNAHHWPTGSSDNTLVAISGGELHLTVATPHRVQWASPASVGAFAGLGSGRPVPLANVLVDVDTRHLSGGAGWNGVTCRLKMDLNGHTARYYLAEIADHGPSSGLEIMIEKWTGRNWVVLQPWQQSTAIKPGRRNHIRVACLKENRSAAAIVMWINGHRLGQAIDRRPFVLAPAPYTDGGIGLAVETGDDTTPSQVVFDNLNVRRIDRTPGRAT
jgi:hypothetical protein